MENDNEQQILKLFVEQYNKAIEENPTLVCPNADPWDGPKPMAKDGFAITFCKVSVIYLYTQNGVNYYQGFDGRKCTWEGLTEIEKEIFYKQNSINLTDSVNSDNRNGTFER